MVGRASQPVRGAGDGLGSPSYNALPHFCPHTFVSVQAKKVAPSVSRDYNIR